MFRTTNIFMPGVLAILSVVCAFGGVDARVSAQCYVEWTRQCNEPPLTNECDGVCSEVGSVCGSYMDAMNNWNYNTVSGGMLGGQESYDQIAPRYCGTIYDCKCALKRDGVTFSCGFSFDGGQTFFNWEYIPSGEQDESCPLPPVDNPFPPKKQDISGIS